MIILPPQLPHQNSAKESTSQYKTHGILYISTVNREEINNNWNKIQ